MLRMGARSAKRYAQKASWASWLPKGSKDIALMARSLLMKLGRRNFPFGADFRPFALLATTVVCQEAGPPNKELSFRAKLA